MVRALKIAGITVLSAGWVLPAYIAVWTFLQYLDAEVAELLRGLEPMHSFPFLVEVQRWMTVAFSWFGLALAFWALVGALRAVKR